MDKLSLKSNATEEEHIWKLYSNYFNGRELHHVALVEGIAVIGLILCFTGYRLLKLAMFTAGFILAFAAFYVISPRFIRTKYCCAKNGNEEIHLASSVLFGIIIGLIVSRLYKLGVFVIGKCLGMVTALVVLQTPLGKYFNSNAAVGSLLAIMAIISGSLASRFEKQFVIAATSFLGSFVSICGVDIFIRSSFSFVIFGYMVYFKETLEKSLVTKWHITAKTLTLPHLQVKGMLSRNSLIMLGAWIILGTIGMILQFKITAKDLQEGGNVCPCSLKTLCCGFCGFLKCCNSSCCDNQKNDGKRNSSECDSSPVYLYIQRPYQDTGGHQQISR